MPNRKKALILGASRYYRESIRSAKNAGYSIVVADRNYYPDTAAVADHFAVCDIVDKRGILEIARHQEIDGIVAVNDYGVPTAAYVAEQLKLPGISEKAAYCATNKKAMRAEWLKAGIPCPRVECWEQPSELYDAIVRIGFPCILKPAHGIGGASRGVVVVRGIDEIEAAIQFSQSFYVDKAILVEEFIDGKSEHSAEVLIYRGVPHVIAISDKVKTPLPYRVDKAVLYPTAMTIAELDSAIDCIARSVTALGIHTGAAHVEGAMTDNGFVLFELGARCGGGGTPEPIVRHVTGVDEFVELVRILVGDQPKSLAPQANRGCSYHFLTPPAGTIEAVRGLAEIRSMQGILDFEFLKKPGDTIYPVRIGTERSGFVIAAAETRDEAYRLGVRAEELLQIDYAN